MGKYVGKTVEIIYLDRKGQITQRKVQVRSIHGSMVRVHPVVNRHAI